ncbi:MAG: ABC transporter ATP-binding protein [Aggregatilineales bacterium]
MATVVDDVSFEVYSGEVFGLAGESGSGKTISMMAVMGLLPPGSSVEGKALFSGRDLLTLSDTELNGIRGRELALLLQDPQAALHPMLSVEVQLAEHIRHHLQVDRSAARKRALELLDQVQIPDPEGSLRAYPHQFSGGMRQRIAIAMALACGPKLLIADEPTTGLDVTVQAAILRLLDELRVSHKLAIILITHDLGVMSAIADRCTVLYSGRVTESGTTSTVIQAPRHPYTKALLNALPRPDEDVGPLIPIRGSVGPPSLRPSGCAFHPRCDYAVEACRIDVPVLRSVGGGHTHACLRDPWAPPV